jgi:RNA polymerase sigma factor (sigma-70 family)
MTIKQGLKINKINIDLTAAHLSFEKGLNVHAFFKTNDHDTGQDLVQDTFLKTWGYLLKGGKIEVMKAFLYHVLNNLIIDEYRKKDNKALSLDALLEKGFTPNTGDYERLFDTIDGKKAMLLIKLLPEMYQKIINMRYIQGLSNKEMSAITGQSKNLITVQAHRGLAKLKVLYDLKLGDRYTPKIK